MQKNPLTGGDGADTFVLKPNGEHHTVTNANPGEDVLHMIEDLVDAGLIDTSNFPGRNPV